MGHPNRIMRKRYIVIFSLVAMLLMTLEFTQAKAATESNESILVITWDQKTQTWDMPSQESEETEEKEEKEEREEREEKEESYYIPYSVPAEESGAKRWMDYRTITDKTSKQWAIQQEAWTDEYGFRRIGSAYCIAMGTYYSKTCGSVFEITLDSGFSFLGMISDVKRDCDTDTTNRHKDGNVVEFVIDKNVIPHDAKVMGDMSYGGTPMRGKIVSISKISTVEPTID